MTGSRRAQGGVFLFASDTLTERQIHGILTAAKRYATEIDPTVEIRSTSTGLTVPVGVPAVTALHHELVSSRRIKMTGLHSVEIDFARRLVVVDGDERHLAPMEAEILRELVVAARTLTKDELVRRVWHRTPLTSSTVRTHIMRIRKKLQPFDRLVYSIRDVGYGFTLTPEVIVRNDVSFTALAPPAQPPVR